MPPVNIQKPFGIEVIPLAGGRLKCLAIPKPRERLGKKAFGDLYDILQDLWKDLMGRDMQRLWRKKRQARFLENLDELYLVINAQNNIVGFNGWFQAGDINKLCICVDLIGILSNKKTEIDLGPEFLQRTIIGRALHAFREFDQKPIYLGTRTQSPHVYLLARQIVEGSLYPNPEDEPPPKEVKDCARTIAEKLGARKLAKEIGEELVWRNSYKPELYDRDKTAASDDKEFQRIDDFFKNKLGQYDAFILVGRAKIPKDKIEA